MLESPRAFPSIPSPPPIHTLSLIFLLTGPLSPALSCLLVIYKLTAFPVSRILFYSFKGLFSTVNITRSKIYLGLLFFCSLAPSQSYKCININMKQFPSLKAPSSIPSLTHMYSHSHVPFSPLCVLLHRAPPSCLPVPLLAFVLLSELFLLLTRHDAQLAFQTAHDLGQASTSKRGLSVPRHSRKKTVGEVAMGVSDRAPAEGLGLE